MRVLCVSMLFALLPAAATAQADDEPGVVDVTPQPSVSPAPDGERSVPAGFAERVGQLLTPELRSELQGSFGP